VPSHWLVRFYQSKSTTLLYSFGTPSTSEMACSTSAGRRKVLTTQLEACFQEIEHLSRVFLGAIERLEGSTLTNLSVESAAEWFRMVRVTCTHLFRIEPPDKRV